MSKTFLLEKDFVIATIMCFKNEKFGEKFVTRKELNYITGEMQKLFNEKGINACITSSIGLDHYKIGRDTEIIYLNYISIKFIEEFYKTYAPLDVLEVVWDHKFIAKKLYELKKEELDMLQKEISIN